MLLLFWATTAVVVIPDVCQDPWTDVFPDDLTLWADSETPLPFCDVA